jgi:hypothetical protein
MTREDHNRHDRELEQKRQAASQSAPIMRRVVLTLHKKWKQLFLFLGVQGFLDLVKEFVRGKLMDQAVERLGGVGQWLKAYPFAFFTIGLCIVILAILGIAIKESFAAEQSAICDEHGIPYKKERIAPAWTRGLSIAAVICVGVISYGTYRYYQIAVGHFKVDANTNMMLPVLPLAPPAPIPDKPPSLDDLFMKDFPNLFRAINNITLEGIDLPMKQSVYLDFLGKSKFVGFYIPTSDPIFGEKTYKMCMMLRNAVQSALDDLPKRLQMKAGFELEGNTIEELTFTRRVILYHEDRLSIAQSADIINAYKAEHFDVQFRGPGYLLNQTDIWSHQRSSNKGRQ